MVTPLDTERRPFTALGYVMMLLILFAGGAIWGIEKAVPDTEGMLTEDTHEEY